MNTLKNPFIELFEDPSKGFSVRELMGLHPVKGEVGLEIEVEGNRFPKTDFYDEYDKHLGDLIPASWEYTHDGSLRGEDNAEYILARPIPFDKVPEEVDKLWKMFDDFGTVLDESNRTSVHVHLNVQEWFLPRLCSFVSLYYIVEDILTHWCGDHRVGNLFCLRAVDAPALVTRVRKFFQTENTSYFSGGMHYSGLNLLALQKLGSVEIRAMRGATDPEVLKTWVAILERIYKLSETFSDPRDVIHGFSGQTREDFFRQILGPYADRVRTECGMTTYEFGKALHAGVRLAQQVCYARDWSNYETKEPVYDAFMRNTAKMPDLEPVVEGSPVTLTSGWFSNSIEEASMTEPSDHHSDYPQEIDDLFEDEEYI